MSTSPSIILTTEFTTSKSKGNFSNFIDYVNNPKKLKKPSKNFEDFLKYQNNDIKNPFGLFNQKGTLNDEDLSEIKKEYNHCQKKEGIIWTSVISFDSDFLKSTNMLNLENKEREINYPVLQRICKTGINEMLESSSFEVDNISYTAGFHFNTEHIHLHISYIEMKPSDWSKERPIKAKDFDKAKSKILNSIIAKANEPFYEKTTEQRNKIRKIFKETIENNWSNEFYNLMKKLPKGNLKMGNNNMKKYQTEIYNLVDKMIDEDNEFKELISEYKSENKTHEELLIDYYGSDENNNYTENKDSEIKKSLANAVLKKITELRDEENSVDNSNLKRTYSNNKDFLKAKAKYKKLSQIEKDCKPIFLFEHMKIKTQNIIARNYKDMMK